MRDETIRLKEYEPKLISDLSDDDALHIANHLASGRRLNINRPVDGEGYWLNFNQHVGVAALPSGRRLEVLPKVPIHSVVHMLSVAHRFPFSEQRADFSRLESIVESMARFFVGLVEERIKRGLYRAYVEREENLSVVRGRIHFPDDLRRNYVLRHRTFCRYAELTWDVPENQIVRQVAHLLTRWDFSPEVRTRLSNVDARLSEVSRSALPPSAINYFRYHRLNEDYREIHMLCRLILEAASLSERKGAFSFPTFLIDMNDLFEGFVTTALSARTRRPMAVHSQWNGHLGHNRMVKIVPDLVVDHTFRPALVADCKYKKVDPEEFKNHDTYQVLAYCVALSVHRGVLIYPKHVDVAEGELRVLNSDVLIGTRTIDLNVQPAQLDIECDRFAQDLFALADRERLLREVA